MAKSKIAIIEDDPAIVQMYRVKFETEGFEVDTAGEGETGLILIEQFQPDIVLLDLMMPIMNGQEMLERLRAQPWGKSTRVIVLTNMGQNEINEKVRSYGIEDFIVKAEMTPKQVSDRVKEVLKRGTGS